MASAKRAQETIRRLNGRMIGDCVVKVEAETGSRREVKGIGDRPWERNRNASKPRVDWSARAKPRSSRPKYRQDFKDHKSSKHSRLDSKGSHGDRGRRPC